MRIQINNKSWYDLSDFDSYEEIEALGEITATKGIPNTVDLKADWDNVQEYLGLPEAEQGIMLAYFKVVDEFNWGSASEAYAGTYATGADFAQALCEEVEYEALRNMPDYLRDCIKWSDVWGCFLHYDFFAQDGHYFHNS